MHFYLITMAKAWNSDQSLKKRSDSTEGIFFCFLLVFLFMVVLFYFYFYFYLLPCFPAFAFWLKTKVETIQERVVFLTPLTLSQNRSRKHRKSHRKASQFDFIVGSYPKFSINIWTENSYEPLKIKVCTHQNQSYMQMVLLSNQTFAILTSSSSHVWILLWCYI